MDYEKEYNEIVGALKALVDNAGREGHIIVSIDSLKNAVPALKNNNERTLGEIITHFEHLASASKMANDNPYYEKYTSWIKWLKERKFTQYDIDDAYLDGICELTKEVEKEKPYMTDDAIREGVSTFGVTQYQIDNWLKKHVSIIDKSRKWTDEDEIYLKRLILYLSCSTDLTDDVKDGYIKWLKSFKHKRRNNQEWSDDDEENLQHAQLAIRKSTVHTASDKKELEEFVASLKNRLL